MQMCATTQTRDDGGRNETCTLRIRAEYCNVLWTQDAYTNACVNGIILVHFRYLQHARYSLNIMYGAVVASLLILKCVQACMDLTWPYLTHHILHEAT